VGRALEVDHPAGVGAGVVEVTGEDPAGGVVDEVGGEEDEELGSRAAAERDEVRHGEKRRCDLKVEA
jgi:hypothetical protein